MSSEVYRVNTNEYSQSIRELEEIYEEVGVVRSDERLSEVFPEQFELYCKHFIDYFPKRNYHTKTTYDSSSHFSGWPLRKSKKSGRPIALIDNKGWHHKTEMVERHLDQDQWRSYNEARDNDCYCPTEFFWLGLHMPKKTTFHAIDADNKSRIGWYGEGTTSNPLMPVMEMPFEHFVFLKKIYDAFPDRIWCITSETLGLDIIQKHNLQWTESVHEKTKRRLERIGYGNTEVHPMSGRCKRRPFGEHYRTITQDGILTTWQQQLEYYLNSGNTPSFRQIAKTLLSALEEQWNCWLGDQYHKRNKGIDVPEMVEKQQEVARQVEKWLDDDCPQTEATSVAIPQDYSSNTSMVKAVKATGQRNKPSHNFNLSELRGGNWAKKLEEIARKGLPAEDCLGEIICEMAKWLYWVELYELSENERHDRTIVLLNQFVSQKHNGYITRWNEGEYEDVLSQVSRCLDSAIALNVPDRVKSLNTLASLRNKRSNGQYKRIIKLEPVILDNEEVSSNSYISSLSTLFSECGLEEEIPEGLTIKIDEKRGRCKIHDYAKKFINLLYYIRQDDNFIYLRREELCEFLLGYKDFNRFRRYNKILHSAEVIDKETYRAKTRPTGYRLTREARTIIDQNRGRERQSNH